MKKIYKILCICLIISLTLFSLPSSAAGNYHDTYVHVRAWEYSDGCQNYSEYREKWDYTSSYAKNYKSTTYSITVWVTRTNNLSDPWGGTKNNDITDRYYGSIKQNWIMSATKNCKVLLPGQATYLPNYVKEDGYKYAGIGFTIPESFGTIDIAWSPDSI